MDENNGDLNEFCVRWGCVPPWMWHKINNITEEGKQLYLYHQKKRNKLIKITYSSETIYVLGKQRRKIVDGTLILSTGTKTKFVQVSDFLTVNRNGLKAEMWE